MKTILSFFIGISILTARAETDPKTIAQGKQPQISTDTKGIIRVAYGQDDKIFCVTSDDNGVTFSTPVLVGEVPDMHLGMTRGPQIASSNRFSIITAMDETGNIHCFKLSHLSKKWERTGLVNDFKGTTPEGLMSIAADRADNFYAVWLDTRKDDKNQIFFSSLTPQSNRWSKNRLVYASPAGHVCECCKPSVVASGLQVAIMFRNWLMGSRDLHFLKSTDKGKSFAQVQKLGEGTWKLNACPMDGGGITIDKDNSVYTAWQRQGDVYYCKAGQKEMKIASGRSVSLLQLQNAPVVLFQSDGMVKMFSVKSRKETTVGKGGFLKAVELPDNKILCVWEENGEIRFRRI